jgi:hypothetical protein
MERSCQGPPVAPVGGGLEDRVYGKKTQNIPEAIITASIRVIQSEEFTFLSYCGSSGSKPPDPNM